MTSILRSGPFVLALLLGGAGLAPRAALAQDHPRRFATFCLFDPLTTTPDRDTVSNFRLALIESHLHGVHGIDLVGAVSTLSGDMRGLQLVGLYSHVGGRGRGILLSGVASHVVGEFRGIHASGLANMSRSRSSGLQFAGVLNFSAGDFRGVQWSLALNMNDSRGSGWQLSSVANVSNGDFTGAQTAFFYNFANHEMDGAQIGILNWARSLDGAQIGVANLADTAKGIQLGVANVARRQDGVPVGLVNLSRNSTANWMTWGSNYVGVETGVRTRIRSWYSILSVGGIYTPETDLRVVSVGWDYGYRFALTRPWSVSVDVGFTHVMPEANDTVDDRIRPAVQTRAFVERAMNARFSIHAGLGGTLEWEAYGSGASTELDPLFFAGVSLFGGQQ